MIPAVVEMRWSRTAWGAVLDLILASALACADAARGAVHGQAEPPGAEGRVHVPEELPARLPLGLPRLLRRALPRVHVRDDHRPQRGQLDERLQPRLRRQVQLDAVLPLPLLGPPHHLHHGPSSPTLFSVPALSLRASMLPGLGCTFKFRVVSVPADWGLTRPGLGRHSASDARRAQLRGVRHADRCRRLLLRYG
eukprot:545455-Rhodomonas_salina.2